jgi:hypothetical protein
MAPQKGDSRLSLIDRLRKPQAGAARSRHTRFRVYAAFSLKRSGRESLHRSTNGGLVFSLPLFAAAVGSIDSEFRRHLSGK